MVGTGKRKGTRMGHRDGQMPRRTGGIRKDELTKPATTSTYADTRDTRERNIMMTQDDLQSDNDEGNEPPRTSSTAIRRANLPATRNTGQQSSPVPQRRTQPQPLSQSQRPYTSASMPAPPISIQQSPRNNPRAKTGREPSTRGGIKGKVHWLLPLGIGMIAMLVLWELGSIALAWGMARYDDIRYGNPRTYQTNAVVGHGGDSAAHPSHFIAINLNRQAIVVEFPAGNPAGAESYIVPYYILGSGGDGVPVTLEFRDVTGDGKLDMIIHIHLQSQDQTFVFVNDGTKFRPANSKDNIHM